MPRALLVVFLWGGPAPDNSAFHNSTTRRPPAMNSELLRLIDSISRDRNVDKELLLEDLEQAMVSAARKHYDASELEEIICQIDRTSGQIRIWRENEPIDLAEMGRIPAQTAKQVMIQKFREDERSAIYNDFVDRQGELITGLAQRYEGGALIVSFDRAEGFMPRREQIPGEQHQPGERVRCLITEVAEEKNKVKIRLSRASPDVIRRLFEVEVPEVAERIIEIRAMAREAGHRTKLAVQSMDSKVDAVGACVGVRGSRIKNIVDELGGEKIDIVRWNDSSQTLIANALKPAEVVEISLCFELGRATVVVNDDQLSLAIGKRGQNVRLAARLTNWDIDILTPQEYTKSLDIMEETFLSVEGTSEESFDRLAAMGIISVFDLEEVGPEFLAEELELEEDLAIRIVAAASIKGKSVAEIQAKEKAAAEAKRKAAALGLAPPKAAAEPSPTADAEEGSGAGTDGVVVDGDGVSDNSDTQPHETTSAHNDLALDGSVVSLETAAEAELPVTDPSGDVPASPDSGENIRDVDPAADADAEATGDTLSGPGDKEDFDGDPDPTAYHPDEVLEASAAQDGSSAEMLADKTDSLQGTPIADDSTLIDNDPSAEGHAG